MTMTKAERAELRSVVRQQFRVLKDEVGQRQAELEADIEKEIADSWADRDHRLAELREAVAAIAEEANQKIKALLVDHPDRERLNVERLPVPRIGRYEDDQLRYRMRAAAKADLQARVGAAMVKLGRQEADLLRQLAVGSLESDEARAFLTSIPSVAELVPASRLQEIEARLEEQGSEDFL